MPEGPCNLKDFLEDGGSHSSTAISVFFPQFSPKVTNDFLRLEDKFSFDMRDENMTRRSYKTIP